MFRIGEFSKLSGLTIDTLYHYEKMNILLPQNIDRYTGYRYYEANQLLIVNKILALKDSDLTLEEISEILKRDLSVSYFVDLLEKKAAHLEEGLNKEFNRLERLRTNIFLIKNGGIPIMNEITIKKVEPILVASIRISFPCNEFDSRLEIMWKEVNEYIVSKGGKCTIPCMMLYHTGWWDMDDTKTLDVEVVEPITRRIEKNEKHLVYELPKVEKMVCIVHKGPLTTIGKTNDTLFDWIRENGYIKKGPVREIYHKGEWETKDPNEFITELQVPIEN